MRFPSRCAAFFRRFDRPMRTIDHARLYIAKGTGAVLVVAALLFLVTGYSSAMQPTPLEQIAINTHNVDVLAELSERIARIEALHLERVLGQYDAIVKMGWVMFGALAANLVGTILQIKGQRGTRDTTADERRGGRQQHDRRQSD